MDHNALTQVHCGPEAFYLIFHLIACFRHYVQGDPVRREVRAHRGRHGGRGGVRAARGAVRSAVLVRTVELLESRQRQDYPRGAQTLAQPLAQPGACGPSTAPEPYYCFSSMVWVRR